MTRTKGSIALLLLLFALPAFLLAHGGGHVRGTVAAVTPSSITMSQEDGKSVVLTLTETTRYFAGESAVAFSSVKVGSRAVVHLFVDGSVAEVHLPAQPKS